MVDTAASNSAKYKVQVRKPIVRENVVVNVENPVQAL